MRNEELGVGSVSEAFPDFLLLFFSTIPKQRHHLVFRKIGERQEKQCVKRVVEIRIHVEAQELGIQLQVFPLTGIAYHTPSRSQNSGKI